MTAKARSEIRHINLDGTPGRIMRLTIFVSDHDAEGGHILKAFLKAFEEGLNENGSLFKSYVAFTGSVKTGLTVRIGTKNPRQSNLPIHQQASLWGKIKAWARREYASSVIR